MATFSKADLVKAIREQCYECNDLKNGWDYPGNDCTGVSCPLYPYRPGNGPGHAVRKVVGKGKGNVTSLDTARARKSQDARKSVANG